MNFQWEFHPKITLITLITLVTLITPRWQVSVSGDDVLGLHRLKFPMDYVIPPVSLEPNTPKTHKRPISPVHPTVPELSQSCYAISVDGKYLFSCGSWDGSVRLTLIDGGVLVAVLIEHTAVVTCMSLSTEGDYLVTGIVCVCVCVSRALPFCVFIYIYI